MDHGDAVRVTQEVVEIFRDPDHAGPLGRMTEHFAIDRLRRQHVETHGRIAGDHEARLARQFTCDDELLQVSA